MSTRFDSLYTHHHAWLAGWLRARLGGCSDLAADLAHDTFLRLWKADRGATPLAEPKAYLATVGRGLLIDHFRRRDLELAYLAALAARPVATQPSEEERAIVLQTLQRLDRLLDGLDPKPRQALLWAQLEGWEHARIAEALGVSVSSVKKYIHKALVHCLACL